MFFGQIYKIMEGRQSCNVEGSVRNINKGMEDGKHFNNFKGTCTRFDIKILNFIFSFPMFIRINLYRSL